MATDVDVTTPEKGPRLRPKQLLSYSLIFVLVPVLTYLIGGYFDKIFSLPKFPPIPANLIAGFVVFFSGLAIGVKATRFLYGIGRGLPWGEVNGQAQSKKLVTSGLYAHCRNPMTLGYSLLPCGMGIMFQSLGMAFIITAVVLLVNIIWLKAWEEPSLERRFGDNYREYKRGTPFLIPKFRPR